MFKGIAERLTKDLVMLAPKTMKIKIVAPPERKYAVWMGGAILAGLRTFQEESWVTAEEYHSGGAEIIHAKCFGMRP